MNPAIAKQCACPQVAETMDCTAAHRFGRSDGAGGKFRIRGKNISLMCRTVGGLRFSADDWQFAPQRLPESRT